jgi:hypothetical protein
MRLEAGDLVAVPISSTPKYMWALCLCGFEVRGSGPHGVKRAQRRYDNHVCPLKEKSMGYKKTGTKKSGKRGC